MTDRAEWLTWRQAGIGASDVAALAGLSPWATPLTVWIDKTQPVTDDDHTEAQWLGLLLEDSILDGYTHKTGHVIDRRQVRAIGPKDWHRATPDGREVLDTAGVADDPVADDPVADSKLTGDAPWNDNNTADGIPDYYLIQSQWQQHCTGARSGLIVAVHTAYGRRQFRWYRIPRNQTLIDGLVALVDGFWTRYVEPRVMPPMDGDPATSDALKTLYPNHEPGVEVEVERRLFSQLAAAKDRLEQAEKQVGEAEQNIKQAMGTAERAVDPDTGEPLATWKTQTTRRLDSAALRELAAINPRAVAWLPYKTTESRTFRPRKKALK